MTKEQQSKLYHTDYSAWCTWKFAQPGEYATEENAKAEAQRLNDARKRTEFEYGTSPNRNGGFDVCMYHDD